MAFQIGKTTLFGNRDDSGYELGFGEWLEAVLWVFPGEKVGVRWGGVDAEVVS